MASNRKLSRTLPMHGQDRAGTAFLFLFPFDLFHLAAGEPVEAALGGSQARVYLPFVDGGDTRLRHRQVSLEHVPALPETRLPHVAAPRLKDLSAELGFAEGAKRADAMRVDLLGPGTPDDAAKLVDRFLELARMVTLQWWITRDRRFDEAYIRNSFSINSHGERLDGVAVMTVVSGRPHIEKPLTRQRFEACVRSAARGARAPLSVLGFCDALHYFSVADYRRFVVESAVACESVLVEHAMRHTASLGVNRGIVKRELEKRNFDERLDVVCATVYGRSFAVDRPDETAWLEALWIARNNGAHGKTLKVRHQGRTYEPGSEEYLGICKALIELFSWLTRFGAFFPDDGPA